MSHLKLFISKQYEMTNRRGVADLHVPFGLQMSGYTDQILLITLVKSTKLRKRCGPWNGGSDLTTVTAIFLFGVCVGLDERGKQKTSMKV